MKGGMMKVLAYIYLVLAVLSVLASPFLIGKDRGEYTAWHYLCTVIETAAIMVFVGRVLGWW